MPVIRIHKSIATTFIFYDDRLTVLAGDRIVVEQFHARMRTSCSSNKVKLLFH